MKKFLLLFLVLFSSCSISRESILASAPKCVGFISTDSGTGTYFFLNYKGRIFLVTAKHIVDSVVIGGKLTLDCGKISKDKLIMSNTFDIAACDITDEFDYAKNNYLSLQLDVVLGVDEVFSVGNPIGTKKIYFFGRISDYDVYNDGWISLPALPGSSGGPVISLSTGKVYGMSIQIVYPFGVMQKIVTSTQIAKFLDTIIWA